MLRLIDDQNGTFAGGEALQQVVDEGEVHFLLVLSAVRQRQVEQDRLQQACLIAQVGVRQANALHLFPQLLQQAVTQQGLPRARSADQQEHALTVRQAPKQSLQARSWLLAG